MHRSFLILSAFCLFLVQPAAADACRDEIVALYKGGAMDEYSRRPYHIEITNFAADGTLTERNTGKVIDGTHYTLFSEVGKLGVLYVGTDVWYSTAPGGPWGSHQKMPAVRSDDLKRQLAEKAESVSEVECLGKMEDAGKTYNVYRWRVFTETSEKYGGGVNGALHEAWVDPESGELAILKDAEVVTPWQKKSDGSTVVTRYRFDDLITINPPE